MVAWSGHRPDLFEDPVQAQATLATVARELVEHDSAAEFVVGGQRGVDTWAAQAAIALAIPLTVILPTHAAEFAADWSAADRLALELTLAEAGHVHVVGGDAQHAYTERNRLLVAAADLLVAVWTGLQGGGTAETIGFARANNTPVREIVLARSAEAGPATGRGR